MLPRRRKREKMGVREDTHIRCEPHKQWVRGFSCSVAASGDCSGKVQAAHIRSAKALETALGIEIPHEERPDGSAGIDPSDNFVVPLCAGHHLLLGKAAQHTAGEGTFWKRHGINPLEVAKQLWQSSPHGKRWRAKGTAL